ncbi:hypothetical protein AYI68_g4227 [Smittium mucronatum]|uniref:Uncharacterized protein n=1 Tax=Smittium mucronatum TaxID=133383 RepID=A0A1R0GXP3_9FUNG|nr:hypothetical protein AYI68_g4227 [Smittium mucronatum]
MSGRSPSQNGKGDKGKKKNIKGMFKPQNLFRSKNVHVTKPTSIFEDATDTNSELAVSSDKSSFASKTKSSLFDNITKTDFVLRESSDDDEQPHKKTNTAPNTPRKTSFEKNKQDSFKNKKEKSPKKFTKRRSQTVFEDLGIDKDRKRSLWDTLNSKLKIRKGSGNKGEDIETQVHDDLVEQKERNISNSIDQKYVPLIKTQDSTPVTISRSRSDIGFSRKTPAKKTDDNTGMTNIPLNDSLPNTNHPKEIVQKSPQPRSSPPPFQLTQLPQEQDHHKVIESINDFEQNDSDSMFEKSSSGKISIEGMNGIPSSEEMSPNSGDLFVNLSSIDLYRAKNKDISCTSSIFNDSASSDEQRENAALIKPRVEDIHRSPKKESKGKADLNPDSQQENGSRGEIKYGPDTQPEGGSKGNISYSPDILLKDESDPSMNNGTDKLINYGSNIFRDSVDSGTNRISLIHPLLLQSTNVIAGKYDQKRDSVQSQSTVVSLPRKSYSPSKKPAFAFDNNLTNQIMYAKIEQSFSNLVMKTVDGNAPASMPGSSLQTPYNEFSSPHSYRSLSSAFGGSSYPLISENLSFEGVKSFMRQYYLKRIVSIIISLLIMFVSCVFLDLTLYLGSMPSKGNLNSLLTSGLVSEQISNTTLPEDNVTVRTVVKSFLSSGMDIGRIMKRGVLLRSLSLASFGIFGPISGYYSRSCGFRESAALGVILSSIGLLVARSENTGSYGFEGASVFLASVGLVFIIISCTTILIGPSVSVEKINQRYSSSSADWISDPEYQPSNVSLYMQNILQIKRSSYQNKNVDKAKPAKPHFKEQKSYTHMAVLVAIFSFIFFSSYLVSKPLLISLSAKGATRTFIIISGLLYMVIGFIFSVLFLFDSTENVDKEKIDALKSKRPKKSQIPSFNIKTVKGKTYQDNVDTLKHLETRNSIQTKFESPSYNNKSFLYMDTKLNSPDETKPKQKMNFFGVLRDRIMSTRFFGGRKYKKTAVNLNGCIVTLTILLISNIGIPIPFYYFPGKYILKHS